MNSIREEKENKFILLQFFKQRTLGLEEGIKSFQVKSPNDVTSHWCLSPTQVISLPASPG